MNIAFRTDATNQIGTGHFMRCMTLADELKKHGAQICFVSRNLPDHLRDMLAAKGMDLVSLKHNGSVFQIDDLAHSAWLGTSQAQDAQDTIQALAEQTSDWLVVDHYALDMRWESAMRKTAKKIMVIDDLADRQHDCELLLDQNFYADMQTRYSGKVPAHCKLLLGPRYALLREEFRKLREQIKPRTGVVKKLLIFFGGVDADNYTGLAIKALADMALKEVHVDVVIGAQHPSRTEIETECAVQGFVCHVQTNKMAELMAASDLAIGAGGTAIWERCCLGLPAISFCVAENQRKQVIDAAEAGLLYAPANNNNILDLIHNHTNGLLENPALLKLISNAEMNAVDGKGVLRIIYAMAISGIEIRQANVLDAQQLFEWRNHPTIRAVSRNNAPILWQDHQKWLSAVFADQNRELLIGLNDNQPIGVLRFDKEGDSAEVSIYLLPDGGFEGQGRNLLTSAEQWLKANRPDIKNIRATVLNENVMSKKLFLGANYRKHTNCYQKDL
jgi:UDP-2,4-diacetamido-2,4,6-trideoxy-beta-L-altropyranose hydrolase